MTDQTLTAVPESDRPMWTSLFRGFRRKCPHCGELSLVPNPALMTAPVAAQQIGSPGDGISHPSPIGSNHLQETNYYSGPAPTQTPPVEQNPFASPSEASLYQPLAFDLATRSRRLVAKMVDIFLMYGVPGVVIGTPAAWTEGEVFDTHAEIMIPLAIISALLVPFINMIMIWQMGQTIGKRMVGIKIVNQTDGAIPGFYNSVVIRCWAIMLISAVVPFFQLIDVMFILGEKRLCLHDRMANTLVVRLRQDEAS